jgi:hypothetical protein
MAKLKTHFEQVPVEIAKRIAREELSGKRPGYANETAGLPARKAPSRSASQSENLRGRQMESPSVIPTCWVCGQQVQLETCKIDETGRALHESCAVARLKAHTQSPAVDSTDFPGQGRRALITNS